MKQVKNKLIGVGLIHYIKTAMKYTWIRFLENFACKQQNLQFAFDFMLFK